MSSLPPKKGPHRMTKIGNSAAAVSGEDAARLQFEAELDASADKVFEALERARSKMTPEERDRAVRNSESILSNATDGVTPRRKRA
jgi:hypothetical protein